MLDGASADGAEQAHAASEAESTDGTASSTPHAGPLSPEELRISKDFQESLKKSIRQSPKRQKVEASRRTGFDIQMDRHEAKYVIPVEMIAEIREFIRPFCEADSHSQGDPPHYTITTLQLDSPQFSLHYAKSNEALNRFKLRVRTYGIPGETVDGMNALAVRGAVLKAVERSRQGKGPTLIEAATYRWYGHSHSDPRAYRTREEEAQWKSRDPITVLRDGLTRMGIVNEEQYETLDKGVAEKLESAMNYSETSPQPVPDELCTDVFAPSKFTEDDVLKEKDLRKRMRNGKFSRQITYVQALQEAMREEMQRNENVFIMGEDVGLYGGAYGATRGLIDEFGEWRVIDTPISEAAIGGAAVGAAMAGMRPIAEIMYVDFTPLAMDQIANQGAKNRYMFGGKTTVPMVIRTEGGAGRAIAAHHSQSLESLWTHFPGIYVVMPSTPYDAKGLLKASIGDDNPVMFIEHKMLYKEKGIVPEEEYIIPLGVADVKREGSDLTIVTYSRMVLRALEAAEMLSEEGIDVEVVDLRTLNPLDIDTVVQSIIKTGRFVGVSEAYENSGFINEVMVQINELAFDWLDAPMIRVAAANVPVPRAEILEDLAIPNVQRIVEACRRVVG